MRDYPIYTTGIEESFDSNNLVKKTLKSDDKWLRMRSTWRLIVFLWINLFP